MKKIVLFLFLLALFTSCASREKIVYFQNISNVNSGDSIAYEPVIKADDLLMIIVSAPDPEAAIPFNLPSIAVAGSQNAPIDAIQSQLQHQTYLVDSHGEIIFPTLGAIKLGGLTKSLAIEKLTNEIKKYITKPIINLRIVNYKISVLGEVNVPGSFTINSDRVTLPEILSKAGDLTIYGDRTKILVIREVNGKKTHNFIDITKADFINSPFYYLSQNDLVYVEPNRTKINSSVVGPNISLIISGASVVLSVIVALILR